MAADPAGSKTISAPRLSYSAVRNGANKRCQKVNLIHLIGYFDGYCQILELFFPFGRNKFQHDTFLRSLSLINELGADELRRKGWVSLKGPKQTGIG